MASYGVACRILIPNEQLEQVDTFPYLGYLITKDGECMTEFGTNLNGAGNPGITAKNMEKSQHTDFNEDTTNKSASGWLVAWHSGRTSVFGRRTFPVLRSNCS